MHQQDERPGRVFAGRMAARPSLRRRPGRSGSRALPAFLALLLVASVALAGCGPVTAVAQSAAEKVVPPWRVAVLIPPLLSESVREHRGRDGASLGPLYSLLADARGFDRVIYFSYACGTAAPDPRGGPPIWTPNPYTYRDTLKSLSETTKQLDCLIGAYTQAAQGRTVEYSLIGYSLGGAVGLRYLETGSLPEHARVRQVVTLGSPVNGINPEHAGRWQTVGVLCMLVCWPPLAPPPSPTGWLASPSQLLELVDSPIARELMLQGRNPVEGRLKADGIVRAAQARGVKVYTYVSLRDALVVAEDAGIQGVPGVTRDFSRGRLLDSIPLPHKVIPWLEDVQLNHGLLARVLDQDEVAVSERKQLCLDLEITCP